MGHPSWVCVAVSNAPWALLPVRHPQWLALAGLSAAVILTQYLSPPKPVLARRIGVQPVLGLEGDPMRLLFERDLTPHAQVRPADASLAGQSKR